MSSSKFAGLVAGLFLLNGVAPAFEANAAMPGGTVIGWGSIGWFGLTPPTNLTNIVAVTVGKENCLALAHDGTVTGWGNGNDLGAAHPPAGLTGVVAIASGSIHSLGLKVDGTVVGWGNNGNGQIAQPADLSDVVAIAAGALHSVAVTAEGRVRIWGGQGTVGVTNVPSTATNVIAIAAGGHHTLAVRQDGTVIAWGHNGAGQCDVPANLEGVRAVAAGSTYSLAVTRDGSVVAWGDITTNYLEGLTNIVALATGCEAWHALALRQDGTVLGWGDNLFYPLNGPAPYTNLTGISVGYGVSLGITREPVLISEPGDVRAPVGTNITLTVGVVGSDPWTYQWLLNGGKLVGQTAGTLSLPNAQVSDSGTYSVVVSNDYGVISSRAVSVVVEPVPPSLVVQPTSRVQLAGDSASFVASAVGSLPLAYQWYFNGEVLPGATNAVLGLTNVIDANAGYYRAVITNAYGTTATVEVTLTVNDPPLIATTPSLLLLPPGTNLVLRVSATGTPPLAYQWQFQGVNLPGATNASWLLSNAQGAQTGLYGVVVRNAFGSVTNTLYTLTVVDSAPLIGEQPASQSFLVGGNASLRVLAYGTPPLAYQWWHGGQKVPDATNQILALANLGPADAGSYSVVLTNALGSAVSDPATLSPGDPYPGVVDWPSLCITPIVSNSLANPVVITHAWDGSGRMFVAELAGRLRIVRDNTVQTPAFLDLTDRVASGPTRGLLGAAFPPGSAGTRHFYVNYTRRPDGASVISRFGVTTNVDVADASSEQILMVIAQPTVEDKGGPLAFGPDGYLYISMGDGGPVPGDPANHGQDPSSLLGKLLRIDVEGAGPGYRVPPDNPFAGNTNYAPEIWATGLQNPCQSFDRLTGDLYLGDASYVSHQEVDFQPRGSPSGQNYGWRVMDGPAIYAQPAGFDLTKLTLPVAWYGPDEGGSVTGGYVYRGPAQARMNGMYFFGDFVSGRLFGLRRTGTNWRRLELARSGYTISAFGEDEAGRLYLADFNSGHICTLQDSRQVLIPVLVPSAGIISSNMVTVTCPTPGAQIHHTEDGRDPTEFDPTVLSGSLLTVAAGQTIKVRAYRLDLDPSAVVSSTFTLRAATPIFTPDRGPITNATPVLISCLTPGATIHYTLTGQIPTMSSPLYREPLILSGGAILRAMAVADGFLVSSVKTVEYPGVRAAMPVFDPPAGPITNGMRLAISCATPGVIIYYTVDGTVPTTNSPIYSGPIVIPGDTTLRALAHRDDYLDSPVQTTFYALVQAASPDFDPASGPLLSGAPISLSCVTQDSLIRYTVDGTDPSTNSTVYSAPLILEGPITLKARAFVEEMHPSDVRTTFYGLQDWEDSVVTTVAGGASPGFTNGVGVAASFSSPSGICLDPTGNLYVADTGNNVIRKIDPSGQVTTFAGTGMVGDELGPATTAQFNGPTGICTDGARNLYVADGNNCNRVCKIDTNGLVSVIAYLRECYYGPGLWQLAADGAGNLYVGSWATVAKVAPQQTVSLLAGTGCSPCPGGWAARVGPAVDASTNIYAATGFQIWRITPAGSVDSVAGSDEGFSDGPRLLSRFRGPQAAAIDAAGNLLVSDYTRIRKIRADGWVTTMAGTGDLGYVNGLGSEAQFNQTAGLCVDGEGNVYVADSGNHCIRKVSPAPDGPPRLQISLAAEQVILLWPVWAGGFALETSPELSAATIWTRVTNGVVRSVNNHVFTNRVGVATGYYRLVYP